jgi:N-acetylglucosaminyl-diphospho-decaprenol L-rhamnosyltransferase
MSSDGAKRMPTVYIPTLAAGERLGRALDGLARQTHEVRVVIADNTDSPSAIEAVRPHFPALESVRFGENLGFGRAINRAVEAHPGDPIVVLNDDAVARPDFVANLLAAARESDSEMVAGVLLRGEGERVVDSAGIVADGTLMAFDYLTGEDASTLERAPDPLGPSGGAALYSASAFERVGGFDEEIFAYYEDLDLALRLRALGARCRLARDAFAVHGYSETLGARTSRKYALTGWGRGYLLRRYGVMRSPRRALRVATVEGSICAAQLLRHRSASGLTGRVRGWRRGGELSRRELPEEGLSELSTREALALRLQRYR